MRIRAVFFLKTILCLFHISLLFSERISYPDFTISMLREGKSLLNYENFIIKKQLNGDFSNTRYVEIFRNLYAKNVIASRPCIFKSTYKIPRIVHQIWLGSKVPEKYHHWMQSWMNWNGWEYHLWTDDDLENISLYNQELFDRASNYGEKSDILRLEILLHYGGLYIDVDYECIKQESFEELHRCFDFYIGFEPLEHGFIDGYNMFKVCNALMASKPNHPLLKAFIVNMKENYLARQHLWTVEKTGPAYLSREIFTYETSNPSTSYRNIYLPSTFFYPISEPEMMYLKSRSKNLFPLPPETAAIHYWSGSWKEDKG